MKKFTQGILILCLLSVFTQTINAQQNKKEHISKALNDYFLLERENIYAHFDKNVFISNEDIWFKGYVFHRKKNTPFFASVNIFASLIDQDGTILETQLLYGDLGNFSGRFTIGDNLKSGKYYVQFYTNWMNNFMEDESSVYEITIINENTGISKSLMNASYSDVNISIYPEGGILLYDTSNTIGITVLGCNNKPINATEAEIVDANGNSIKKIPLNKAGYGKFDIIANSTYKVCVTINGVKHEQLLPGVQQKGIAPEVNSYIMADKTIIKLRTNKSTLESFSGRPVYIVAHKDEKTTIFEIILNSLEQTITIPNTDLFEGLNTLRILDNDLNELSQRLVYVHPQAAISTQLNKTKQDNGIIEFTGKTNPNMNLSISVLPSVTHSIKEDNDIYGALLLTPYLETKNGIAAKQYLTNLSRASKYELDLLLLNQKSKYGWRDILKNPPKSTYTFDIGLGLKGTINQPIKSSKDYTVKITSIGSMISETVKINEKNEFFLNNLILPDSTKLSFTLMKGNVKMQDLKLYPQISNNNRKFNKPYKPQNVVCTAIETGNNEDLAYELPKQITKSIVLEDVEIDAKATTKLKHGKSSGNAQLRAYKITDTESKMYFYILDLIRYHGFDVTNNGVDVSITGRTINTFQGQKTQPMVYVDNMRVLDYSQLIGVQTDDVDEFYINQHAIVPSVDNKMGIIKIYMKKDFSYRGKNDTTTSFIVKEGFEKVPPFKNSEYISTYDNPGFENYGLIDWQPQVTTDEKGEFKFSIPKLYNGNVKILIEGLSPDGKMISEIKTIAL